MKEKEKYKKDVKYIRRVNIYRREMPLWLRAILRTLFIILIILCAIIAVFNFIYIRSPVIGPSMYPTLNSRYYEDENIRDTVYINRFAGFEDGDIIVVNKPTEQSADYVIKRVIAKGGEKFAIIRTDNGGVSLNNGTFKLARAKKGSDHYEIINEDYLPANISLYHSYLEFQELLTKTNLPGCKVVTVDGIKFLEIEENYVFYVGDNRSSKEASNDCLDYGPVEVNKVVGRVNIIVYEDKNHFNQIFMYFIHAIFG